MGSLHELGHGLVTAEAMDFAQDLRGAITVSGSAMSISITER